MALKINTIKKRSTFIFVREKKRLGNAVKRNKAKRLMRELTRKVLPIYGKINFYYVLIAKISIFETPFLELEKELKKIIS